MAQTTRTIASLKNRVILCSQEDVVETGGIMTIARTDKVHSWACIYAKKGSLFSPVGFPVLDSRNVKTHEAYLRYRRDFDITISAWIYEERLQSAPRWYKILTTADNGEWWELTLRLVEKSDELTKPIDEVARMDMIAKLPQGLKL